MTQVRAGVLQVPPALVISCCPSVQQGALTLGGGWVTVLAAACPPGGRADEEGVSRHHAGHQDSAAAREPCRRGGRSSSEPRRVLACMPRCSLPRAALAAALSHRRHFNESWAEPQPPLLPGALAGQRVSSTGTGTKPIGGAAGCRKTSGSCLGSRSLNSSGCCSLALVIAAVRGWALKHIFNTPAGLLPASGVRAGGEEWGVAAADPGRISSSGCACSPPPCCHKLMAQHSDMSPLPCFSVGTFDPAEQDMLLALFLGELP